MDFNFELVICIVNSGFAEDVMSAAREAGATGGTVINARGTAREEAEKLYNIVITPEKEIVMILVSKEIKDAVLRKLYEKVGLNTSGSGIVFSVPVDEVAGLSQNNLKIYAENKNQQNEQK